MARLDFFTGEGAVNSPAHIRPANNGSFPLIDAHDVQVGSNPTDADDRLDATLEDIDAAINTINSELGSGSSDTNATIKKRLAAAETNIGKKVNTSDIQTTVRAAASASDSKVPSEKAVRSAIDNATVSTTATPASGSTAAFSAGGAYTELAKKVNTSDIQSTVNTSSNPPSSNAVKTYVDAADALKINTSDIQTTVRAAASASDSKVPSEKAVRSAIDSKTITIDTTVTEGSANAVSGGAVHTQLATKQDTLTFDTTPTASSSNPVTSGGVKTALDTKQDTLTFDTTPTASSSNPVTSGGVKAALDNKQNTLTYETTPIVGSVNPVTSTGIRNAIDTAAAQNLGAMQAAYDTFSANISARVSSLSNGMVACSNIAAETTVGDTRILLYTGTTNSRYTNGHWYYNSAASNQPPSWTDGGAVGSAPTIDNTLTTAGAAADSKSVGDAIENIVTISNTQPGANSGNKVWIKETTNEEVQVPTYEEHISKANKADITTNNESDNGSGTITASKAYAIGDHFYINNTNTSSENFGVSTLYKATAAIASGSAIVVGTNCEASKIVDDIALLSSNISTLNESLDDVKAELKQYNSFDVLTEGTHESRELYGVTWAWNADNTICTASGTATSRSRSRYFVSDNSIPSWITPGKTYHIKIQSTGTAPAFYLAWYQNGSLTYEKNYRTDAVITIPSDITGFIATLQVATGYSVNGTISVQMLTGETSTALFDDFKTVDGIGNKNAKMRSFGNSILTGSVWQNGSGVGLVEYDDSPYGQIAKALNIPKDNVTHTLISSTGLIYDAGFGSFLDNIKNTDLSGYDYLLTMFWTTDLEHTYALGTINDTASDQTLAGAVVDLVTYMHTSNGNCQLILVSVPPVSYTHAGDNVFTDLHANGFNIHDLDILMRQMARKYHFIFLDWEQMALSYYYQNYTDGDNVHANNAVTYRVMGEYLGRCLRCQQDIPKNKELKYNSYNILDYVGQYKSRSLHGVTFTWNSEHTECTANGTADGGRAYVNIYNNPSAMPDGINPELKYNVTFTTTDVKFALVFGLYDTLGSHIEDKVFRSDGVLEIPDGCGGMYIRLFVDNGRSVTNAVASNIALFNADTNYQLSQDVAQIYGIETGYDVLTRHGNFTDRTFRGITFTWSGRQCHVSGTADGGEAYCNIYYGLLPDGMMSGDLYRIRYESTTGRIGVHWYFYDKSGTLISDAAGSSDMEMSVPVGASVWLIRIYVRNGVTIDGYLTRLQVVKMKPLEMDIPLIVSFVDDDTTRDELVTKFHDACCHNVVKGNYAVITKSVEDGNTSASKLVAYEDEGFGLLIHCYQQHYQSDSPWNPEGGVRTEAQTNACRANLAKGIRQMIDMGLLNYDYWITPGGHMEPDLIDVAKQLSLKCLISTNNGRENNMTDYDKYFIKRVSFGATDTPSSSSLAGIKALIDEVASRGKGWLIITTHFNDGWGSLTWDTTLDANGYPIGYARFNEMVQYAISKGMIPMSIPQAWKYYEPILNANRVECNEANA